MRAFVVTALDGRPLGIFFLFLVESFEGLVDFDAELS